MNIYLSLLITNSLDVLGVLSLRTGLLWRRNVQQHLLDDKWLPVYLTVYLFLQIGVFYQFYDSFQWRHILTITYYALIMLLCVKELPKNNSKLSDGESLCRAGLFISCGFMMFIGLSQWYSDDPLVFIGLMMFGLTMIIIVLSGTLLSLVSSDLIELHFKNSITDPLTGVFNRRHFMNVTDIQLRSAQRDQSQTSFIMCDIDFFKGINDEYGHQTGDDVICMIANTLKEYCRETDTIARFGGEEFMVLLPKTGLEDAKLIANRMRCHIEQSTFQLDEKRHFQFTASFGVSTGKKCMDTHDYIKVADDALYQAKSKGRNCVIGANLAI